MNWIGDHQNAGEPCEDVCDATEHAFEKMRAIYNATPAIVARKLDEEVNETRCIKCNYPSGSFTASICESCRSNSAQATQDSNET